MIGGNADESLSLSELYPFQLAAAGSEGLFVLGWKEHRIYMVDSGGRVVDSLGHQGEGPGEFEDALALARDNDGVLYAVDLALRRVDRWDSGRKVLDPIPITWRVDHPKTAFTSGGVWYQTVAPTTPDHSEIQLVFQGSGGPEVVARVPRQPRRVVDFPTCNGKEISVQPFFAPTLVWAVAGENVAVASGEGYSVRVARAGKTPVTIDRDVPPIAATSAAALVAAQDYKFNGCLVPAQEAVTAIGYLPVIPRITDLALAPDGSVWVERRTDDGIEKRIDLFDSTGTYQGTLPREFPFPSAFLSNGRVVTVERDSLDVPRIAAYRVESR